MTPQTLNEQWIFSTLRNGLFVLVDGKPYALKCTKHQMDSYTAYLKAKEDEQKKAAAEAAGGKKGKQTETPRKQISEVVADMAVDSLTIIEIAMNPTPEQHDFPKDRIEKLFDCDQIRIIAAEWLERKIFAPMATREKDPLFAAAPA